MTHERINLQNTPERPGVKAQVVRFESHGVRLTGDLYTPAEAPGPLPGVVVTGAWTTVKDQMAGTYARELAARGFAALAFDFAGWGASEGTPRYVEDPKTKTDDIRAAARFMASRSEVDAERVFGLGICASAGYMASAVADGQPLRRLALVAPWLHTPAMATEIYGGEEAAAGLIRAGQRAQGGVSSELATAASTTEKNAIMYQAPYYTETDRGLIASYDNKFNVASWAHWLRYDAHASASRLQAPTLVMCSEAAALPAGAHQYVEATEATVEEIWLDDVNQFDFYDRVDVVKQAADATARHFSS